MTYDFTSIIDRRGMDAIAVDLLGQDWAPDAPKDGFDPIPMWVADMNFPTCPTIQQAIIERAQHPCFGTPLDALVGETIIGSIRINRGTGVIIQNGAIILCKGTGSFLRNKCDLKQKQIGKSLQRILALTTQFHMSVQFHVERLVCSGKQFLTGFEMMIECTDRHTCSGADFAHSNLGCIFVDAKLQCGADQYIFGFTGAFLFLCHNENSFLCRCWLQYIIKFEFCQSLLMDNVDFLYRNVYFGNMTKRHRVYKLFTKQGLTNEKNIDKILPSSFVSVSWHSSVGIKTQDCR